MTGVENSVSDSSLLVVSVVWEVGQAQSSM